MIIVSSRRAVDVQCRCEPPGASGVVSDTDTIVRGITRGACAFLKAFIIHGAPN